MKKAIVGSLVKFTFKDGVEDYTFDCAKMSAANREYAIPFAMSHRLGDNAALSRTAPDGSTITVTEAMRREAVAELGDWLMLGGAEWEKGRSRVIAQNPVWAKLAEARGVDYAVIASEKAAADLAELEALANS